MVGRGIDVTGISHIVNYDIPHSATTTSIASAAPAAWVARASPTPSSRPRKGSELTRIEMRIDRLLRRFEVVGFESGEKPVGVPTAGDGAAEGEAAEAEPAKEPAPPMFGRGGRPLKRYRRAFKRALWPSRTASARLAQAQPIDLWLEPRLLKADFRKRWPRDAPGEFLAVGLPARIIVARRMGIAQHDGGHRKASAKRRRDGQGLQRLIDHAQLVACHDDQRKSEIVGHVGHVLLARQWRQQSARSFDQHHVGPRQPIVEARPQQALVDLTAFRLGRQMRRQRSGKSLWANGRQLSRPAGGLPEGQGVVGNQPARFAPAAAGRGLVDPHPASQFDQIAGNQCGDIRFADAGVGPGDEQTFNPFARHIDALSVLGPDCGPNR